MNSMVRALIVFALSWTAATGLWAQEHRYEGKLGYLTDGMQYLRERDTRLAFELWIDELAHDEQIGTTIDYYDHGDEVIEAFREFRCDLLGVNPIFYLRDPGRVDAFGKAYWVVQKGPHLYEKMVVLVRRDSGIGAAADLKGRSVIIRDDNYMGRVFLDKVLLEAEGVGVEGFVREVVSVKKHSSAILKTFFGGSDACVVPEYVLDTAAEMNPALKRDLVVLARSPRVFMPILGVFHLRTPDWVIEAFTRNARKLENTPRGQNILDLFKMKRMVRILYEDLEPLKTYYREYEALRARYGRQP